jgi:hypothetical protein
MWPLDEIHSLQQIASLDYDRSLSPMLESTVAATARLGIPISTAPSLFMRT